MSDNVTMGNATIGRCVIINQRDLKVLLLVMGKLLKDKSVLTRFSEEETSKLFEAMEHFFSILDDDVIELPKPMRVTLCHVSIIRKCIHDDCDNEGKILEITHDSELNDIAIAVECKDCFLKNHPDYTLDSACKWCSSCFDCDIQRELFSTEEIEEFKKRNEQ